MAKSKDVRVTLFWNVAFVFEMALMPIRNQRAFPGI